MAFMEVSIGSSCPIRSQSLREFHGIPKYIVVGSDLIYALRFQSKSLSRCKHVMTEWIAGSKHIAMDGTNQMGLAMRFLCVFLGEFGIISESEKTKSRSKSHS